MLRGFFLTFYLVHDLSRNCGWQPQTKTAMHDARIIFKWITYCGYLADHGSREKSQFVRKKSNHDTFHAKPINHKSIKYPLQSTVQAKRTNKKNNSLNLHADNYIVMINMIGLDRKRNWQFFLFFFLRGERMWLHAIQRKFISNKACPKRYEETRNFLLPLSRSSWHFSHSGLVYRPTDPWQRDLQKSVCGVFNSETRRNISTSLCWGSLWEGMEVWSPWLSHVSNQTRLDTADGLL